MELLLNLTKRLSTFLLVGVETTASNVALFDGRGAPQSSIQPLQLVMVLP